MKRYIIHSAKGSTWEDHKYVKRIDGTYYYPSGYTKGRTVDSLSDSEKKQVEENGPKSEDDLSSDDIENLAMGVIRGNFANGQERKERLGEYYQKVQSRVNELMKKIGSKPVADYDLTTTTSGEKAVKKAVASTSTVKSGIDMEQVFNVYRKKGV